jgi:surface protein
MESMFFGCTDLKNLDLSNFDTKNVTNMSGMFEECTELKNLNLGNFVFPSGCKMENIFLFCKFDNLCIPNTRKRCWCCCGRYVDLKGEVVVKLNQNNVEFEGE